MSMWNKKRIENTVAHNNALTRHIHTRNMQTRYKEPKQRVYLPRNNPRNINNASQFCIQMYTHPFLVNQRLPPHPAFHKTPTKSFAVEIASAASPTIPIPSSSSSPAIPL